MSVRQLTCNRCGKPVSTGVPHNTVVRAWVECPECMYSVEDDMADALRRLLSVDEQPPDAAPFKAVAARRHARAILAKYYARQAWGW